MTRKVELSFFFLLIAGAALVSFFVLKPYLSALFIALVFSIAFRPVHTMILRVIRRENIAAFLALMLLFLAVCIPAVLFGFFVFDDARTMYNSSFDSTAVLERTNQLAAPLEKKLQEFFPDASVSLSEYIKESLSFLVGNLGEMFSGAVSIAFKTAIMLLALFFLFRDGKKLRSFVIRLSPLSNEYDDTILTRIEDAISSVVKGKLFIVLIQGILAALAFFFFGIPHAGLLGAITALAALVPFVGVALVFVPAVLYLFFNGAIWALIGLLIAAFVVGTVDNILAPILYEKGLRMHPLLILLSVLGGLMFFGPVGFLAGPVTLSLLLALLDIYPLLSERQE